MIMSDLVIVIFLIKYILYIMKMEYLIVQVQVVNTIEVVPGSVIIGGFFLNQYTGLLLLLLENERRIYNP